MPSPILEDEQITFADFIVDYAYAITAIISKVVKKDTHFQRNSLIFIICFTKIAFTLLFSILIFLLNGWLADRKSS